MKNIFATVFISLFVFLISCKELKAVDGAYDFIIYESDNNNNDLSDNPVVSKYHIEYVNAKTVTDTLIKKGSIYFLAEDSDDYIILEKGPYGLYYTKGFFKNSSLCKDGEQIDISWSKITVNGKDATTAIGETPLEGLNEFGFIINGWA